MKTRRETRTLRSLTACAALLCLSALGCATAPSLHVEPDQIRKNRQLQTRLFETDDEARIVAACITVLQDTGFTIGETDEITGLISGSKTRRRTGDIKKKVLGVSGLWVWWPPAYDDVWEELRSFFLRINAAVTTRLIAGNRVEVRVVLDQQVLDYRRKVIRSERITMPEIYREFFTGLSSAASLKE
jgi:hypothetical protein